MYYYFIFHIVIDYIFLFVSNICLRYAIFFHFVTDKLDHKYLCFLLQLYFFHTLCYFMSNYFNLHQINLSSFGFYDGVMKCYTIDMINCFLTILYFIFSPCIFPACIVYKYTIINFLCDNYYCLLANYCITNNKNISNIHCNTTIIYLMCFLFFFPQHLYYSSEMLYLCIRTFLIWILQFFTLIYILLSLIYSRISISTLMFYKIMIAINLQISFYSFYFYIYYKLLTEIIMKPHYQSYHLT
eukprot:248013_1